MRKKTFNYTFYNFINENISLFIFTTVLFIMGVIFGSFLIYSLSINQKQELISYISGLLYDISNDNWQNPDISFKYIFFDNAKYLFFIWFLGLSVIGMPLIFLIVFMKGLIIGFTISFLISEMSWKGFIFAVLSIVPQNLIIVPVFIVASVAGTLFSLSLIKGRGQKLLIYQQSFTSYSMLTLLLIGFLLLSSLIETFISPYLIKIIAKLLIN